MITAKYGTPTGIQQVEIIRTLDNGKAQVSPLDWRGSGYWWDRAPIWIVEQADLFDIIYVCPACGAENDPSHACDNCGWDWRDEISDEEDTRQTEMSLRAEYQGGQN